MYNDAHHSFILLIPVFLICLGFITGFLWIKQRQFLSIFWLSISLISTGVVLFLQGIISIPNLHKWSMLIGPLYVFTSMALAQSIALRFNTQLSWTLCLWVIAILEIGLFYYALIIDKLTVRFVWVSVAMVVVFCHQLPVILRTTPKHQVDQWLKVAFVFQCICMVLQTLFKIKLMLEIDSNYNFVQTYGWFIAQLFVLMITVTFSALLIASNVKDILNVHQLELENTKLQERLQLSHDLHDILGSSLVRSMSMISQSEKNLDNQQVLSMLKIFRDDLRQVIDSGSSTGADVPKTPILWGAPIRHRFSQIFDELGIHAEWKFTPDWLYTPTPLECLTLQRVAEEALTNIIKHSQAKNVSMTLYFVGQDPILTIEDDGVGFDAEAIKQSGMSIGLKSMQQRLNKIHYTMLIESKQGKTVLIAKKLVKH